MATWRRKIAEYEANLFRIEEPSFLSKFLGLRTKNGELEVKTYDDGEKVMEVELYGVKAPNGVAVSVVVDCSMGSRSQINKCAAQQSVQRTRAGWAALRRIQRLWRVLPLSFSRQIPTLPLTRAVRRSFTTRSKQ